MRAKTLPFLVVSLCLGFAPVALAGPKDFKASFPRFVDQLRASPYAPPGFAVVVIKGGDTVFARAYGVANTATGRRLTLDTPIYNASTTKAYTGLLAAVLDASGAMPLDTTLTDVWPGITLPPPGDPTQVTARGLLSHSSGLDEYGTMLRSNSTGEITAADVPLRLSKFSKSREKTFRYQNFGPYVYSAMAEVKTGQDWHTAIERHVFEPLRLSHTYTRVEDIPGDPGACHILRETGQWTPVPPKPTPVLNAAGGIYTSAKDSGAFLKAFMTDGRSAQGRIPAAVLRRTWRKEADQNQDLWGLHRDGYGLGWDLGTYGSHRFVARSGGKAGCRSMIMFLPEENLGVVVLSLGDAAVNTFNSSIVKEAIDEWTDVPGPDHDGRAAAYLKAAASEAARYAALGLRLKTAPAPDAALLASARGVYEHPRLGRYVLGGSGDHWTFTAGLSVNDILGQPDGTMVIMDHSDTEAIDTFKPIRNAQGQVTAFLWDDDQFERVFDR